eukprot:CAMPEP_0114601662 /NCGR_PEP_ID=MMETSP0125-20121206/24273_1 /TAXON_ID=485358 ORGANISM="Aristerostoma sp., Strain ATCC 50986" /NCGR_SAMPLE_ID=MMETSP0125 /ASSEMBLY_ACC=CAM_ASM_000245 /LENGTH=157 /DNA_ID=CAMNT_0001811099 /DNA_START=373 /DNA_END=843 /DNA_ORIENTATION=-
MEEINIDYSKPTLVFAECVLVYLPTKDSDALIKFFTDKFSTVYMANWEMMKLNDQFGKMMIKNFEMRHIDLLGIHEYPDVESQKKRFADLGYTNVEVYDMLVVYNQYIDQDSRKRAEKLEFLDELEEWWLIQKHYYLSLSSKIKDQDEKTKIVKIST